MSHKSNRLIHESSPYLLQHANNPVEWYPWGTEAFERARHEDKPVLISIGYSACHWCHVMEKESFENEATALLMNKHFINIKIDREERPDLDHIYMDAVQALTGSGGWPLNVFLLPDGKPFFGGTYFPPINAYNRRSWTEILHSIKDAYANRKTELENQANNLTNHLIKSNAITYSSDPEQVVFSEKHLDQISDNLLKNADKEWGGFGAAPKFPQTFSIQYLLRNYYFTNNEDSLKHALLSIDKMIYGGINDQLGGGFARYSTDDKWLVPHFEKMLYDNALLLNVICEAYQITGKASYKAAIEETLAFVTNELMNEDGGFFCALDADSEGVEGKYYTWNIDEINDILKENAPLFCQFYDITNSGNWEHRNILWVQKPIELFAKENNLDKDELKLLLDRCRAQLMEVRNARIRPQLDDKIILGWNALMNIACCKAFAATGNEQYKTLAEKNMQFIETAFKDQNSEKWLHTYKNNAARFPAFLDDYANLISAYIHLQEVTGNQHYLLKAKKLTAIVIKDFLDTETGYFYYTADYQQDVIIRKKEVYDGAMPSGNSTMAQCLYYLSVVFEKKEWNVQSLNMLQQLEKVIVKYPTSFGNWCMLLQLVVFGNAEIIVAGNDANEKLFSIVNQYIPNKIFQAGIKDDANFPLFNGKAFGKKSLIYFCKNFKCEAPFFEVEKINNLLK